VHDGTRWQSAGPAHDAALRAIAQAFADLDLTHGRRQDRGAWEMLDKVEAAYTGFASGSDPTAPNPTATTSTRKCAASARRISATRRFRKKFRANLRRRLLRAALDDVAHRQLSARATKRQIRARGDEIQRHLQRAGLLRLVGRLGPLRRRLRNGSRPGLSLHQRSLGVPDLKAIVVEPNRSPVLAQILTVIR